MFKIPYVYYNTRLSNVIDFLHWNWNDYLFKLVREMYNSTVAFVNDKKVHSPKEGCTYAGIILMREIQFCE